MSSKSLGFPAQKIIGQEVYYGECERIIPMDSSSFKDTSRTREMSERRQGSQRSDTRPQFTPTYGFEHTGHPRTVQDLSAMAASGFTRGWDNFHQQPPDRQRLKTPEHTVHADVSDNSDPSMPIENTRIQLPFEVPLHQVKHQGRNPGLGYLTQNMETSTMQRHIQLERSPEERSESVRKWQEGRGSERRSKSSKKARDARVAKVQNRAKKELESIKHAEMQLADTRRKIDLGSIKHAEMQLADTRRKQEQEQEFIRDFGDIVNLDGGAGTSGSA